MDPCGIPMLVKIDRLNFGDHKLAVLSPSALESPSSAFTRRLGLLTGLFEAFGNSCTGPLYEHNCLQSRHNSICSPRKRYDKPRIRGWDSFFARSSKLTKCFMCSPFSQSGGTCCNYSNAPRIPPDRTGSTKV